MALRLHSEEYNAHLKNEQTEPQASAVWEGFVKNQAQCINYCKHLSISEKNIWTVINIAPTVFVFLAPILYKTHKMFYWFRVIYASSSFVLTGFPSFPMSSMRAVLLYSQASLLSRCSFRRLLDIDKICRAYVSSFLKTFSFWRRPI